MARIAPNEQVKQMICNMGLDPAEVQKLSIHFAANDIILVDVTMFAKSEMLNELVTFTKHYELKEKENK